MIETLLVRTVPRFRSERALNKASHWAKKAKKIGEWKRVERESGEGKEHARRFFAVSPLFSPPPPPRQYGAWSQARCESNCSCSTVFDRHSCLGERCAFDNIQYMGFFLNRKESFQKELLIFAVLCFGTSSRMKQKKKTKKQTKKNRRRCQERVTHVYLRSLLEYSWVL